MRDGMTGAFVGYGVLKELSDNQEIFLDAMELTELIENELNKKRKKESKVKNK